MDTRAESLVRLTAASSVANLVLSLGKVAAGVLGNSAAMVADGAHSASDLLTDLGAVWVIRAAGRPKDSNHNYGHGKFETLGSLLIAGSLLAVGIALVVQGVRALVGIGQGRALPEPGLLPLIAAIVSIGVKETLFQIARRAGRKYRSLVTTANAWHHRSDALSSVASLLGIAGARMFGEEYRFLDPLAAILVSAVICWTALKILRESMVQLSEASIDPDLCDRILETCAQIPGVCDPHNLRTRWVGSTIALDLHIRVDGALSVREGHERASQVEVALRGEFGDATMMNIHVEPTKE